MKKDGLFLIVGDFFALAIVTIVGFVTHGEGSLEYLPRMAAAFFPLLIAWLILGPWFELFDPASLDLKTLGRVLLAVIFAAPLALIFRGLLLNAPILPIFAVVFTLTSAFGLVIWRGIYYFIKKQAVPTL